MPTLIMNPTIIFFLIYFTLLFGGVAYLELIKKKQDTRRNIDPFTDDIDRPAGESLRIKIEGIQETINDYIMVFMFGVVASSVAVLLNVPSSVQWVIFAAGLVAIFFSLNRLTKMRTSLFNHRLGYQGEIVVAQHLNSLLVEGYEVFHDIVFENRGNPFNIDHVVIGSSGVYAIETKTRRKPKHMVGKIKAQVIFDGTQLAFPTFTDRHGIEQAILNANTLSKELGKSTGEPVAVSPILTLPGWYVDRKGNGELTVVNPKELLSAIRGKRKLQDDQLMRISHQLKQRCVY